MADSINEIKKGIKENRAVIGTELTLKSLKLGKLKKVYMTSNCPAKVKGDIEHYSRLAKTETESLDIPNDELGVICKKQFSISVMGLKA